MNDEEADLNRADSKYLETRERIKKSYRRALCDLDIEYFGQCPRRKNHFDVSSFVTGCLASASFVMFAAAVLHLTGVIQ